MTPQAVIRMRSGTTYQVEQTVEEIDERLADVEHEDQGFLHVSGYHPTTNFGDPPCHQLRLKIYLIETIEER